MNLQKKTMKRFRDNGAIGALLDEYEKALNEVCEILDTLTPLELTTIVDYDTKDEDCRSIQTILSHLISSGYTYVAEIRKHQGEEPQYKDNVLLDSVDKYKSSLWEMFESNLSLFSDYPDIKMDEKDNSKKFKVRWGQTFDPHQLMQHAIVHILRHRRQIERFLQKLR